MARGLSCVNLCRSQNPGAFPSCVPARNGGGMTLCMFSHTREDRIILHVEKAKTCRAVLRKKLFQLREGKKKKNKPEKPHRRPLLCLHRTYLIIQCLQTISTKFSLSYSMPDHSCMKQRKPVINDQRHWKTVEILPQAARPFPVERIFCNCLFLADN